MLAEETLRSVEYIVKRLGDEKVIGSYYLEFSRRLEVLRLVEKYCEPGTTLLDLGAQPFIILCAFKRMGYITLWQLMWNQNHTSASQGVAV
jgi:hypothetical protein